MMGAGVVFAGAGNLLGACTVSAQANPGTTTDSMPDSSSSIQPQNPLDDLQVIASGFIWTEGPVWVGGHEGFLLFSDVPGNTIYRWNGESTSVFLSPSGYEGFPIPDHIREGGSNGLALGRDGLLIADSGNRCVSLVNMSTRRKTMLVDRFEGKRLNSPNDLVVASNGDIYFTDPPFGLTGVRESSMRELEFTGVYRVTPDNQIQLIADNLFPNGISLSPDNRVLYVTDTTGWVAIDLDSNGEAVGQRLLVPRELAGGGGDGMKTDTLGNLWCSVGGGGGIQVFSPQGERIGHAPIDGRVSNCAFGPDGHLFVTNGEQVLKGKITPPFNAGVIQV